MRSGVSRREFLKTCSVGAAVFGLTGWFRARADSGSKPNIIFMVADNLGRESVGFYKDDATEESRELAIETPWLHLDLYAVFAGLAGPRCRRTA